MTKIIYWSLTVAVAGFLFGFDTAVISGADQSIQALWQTSPLFHGLFVMSSALWGTVIGALFGNVPSDKFGRKNTLILIGVLYLVSAIGSAIAQDPYTFAILRFIGGLGVGASSIAVPAYISELAPAKNRGRLVATYQFQIVFGILVAFLSNYLLSGITVEDWRVMLGVEAIPALVFLLLVVRVPESPRWLILFKNDSEKAKAILTIAGEKDVDNVVAAINEEAKTHQTDPILTKTYLLPITLSFFIAFFNQLSGINFIIYFAPRIFELAGLSSSSALLSSAGVGLTNLLFTMLGLYLIDNFGRKQLMIVGSIGYIVSLSAITWAFGHQAEGLTVVFFVFLFIASHAIGQGAVIWVFISEIFPNAVRTKGQAIGCGTHWVFAALITLVMPWALDTFSADTIFGLFTIMMILQLIFVLKFMPETKGKSLEEISQSIYHRKASQGGE